MKRAWLAVALLLLGACSRAPEQTPPPAPTAEEIAQARAMQSVQVGLERVTDAIGKFQRERSRSPTNLQELVRTAYLPSIPPLPNGLTFRYDPHMGSHSVAAATNSP